VCFSTCAAGTPSCTRKDDICIKVKCVLRCVMLERTHRIVSSECCVCERYGVF
jgi:hypothetical protein